MDKKTVLAFIFIGAIILLMPYYYNLIMPERPEEALVQQDQEYSRVQEDGVRRAYDSPVQESAVDEIIPSREYDHSLDTLEVFESEEKIVSVETPLYIAKFSSRGGKIISFKLKEYSDRRGGITELILVHPQNKSFYPNGYLTFPANNLSTNRLNFTFSREDINVKPGETAELVLTANVGENGEVRNIYRFNSDNYRLNLRTMINGIRLDDEYFFRWDGGVNVTELDTVQDLSYSKAYFQMGGEIETFDAKGKGVKETSPTGVVDWMAVRAKYFEIAVLPSGNTNGVDFAAEKIGAGKMAYKEFKLAMKMNKTGSAVNQEYSIYLGPIDSRRLSTFAPGLENTMNWGLAIIRPISKVVLWSFKQIHRFIPNYGVVIIIFSILIKIILWPLTKKQHVSMKQMQLLGPHLKELKAKYKDDPQKFQKEQVKLFKEKKINPYGGCLPMFLQMPILIAMFMVFRSTIELRGAPFMLWIQDLSLPDTIMHLGFTIPMYGNQVALLPLVMGVSTFFQSKSTVTDPNQKMLIYFMPIFLTLMFNSFPSGLTLYYTLFNILSIFQQKMIKMPEPAVEVGTDPERKKPRKK